MADESDDSDEWGMEELDIPAKIKGKATAEDGNKGGAEDDEAFWAKSEPAENAHQQQQQSNPVAKEAAPPKDDRPLIIVDMTNLDDKINNKFDKNGCSDIESASALRKQIEKSYAKYASDSELLENGTIIPCGMSVWRGALARLRDERPGHYFAPIFPPKGS